jgi:hypothetical protein
MRNSALRNAGNGTTDNGAAPRDSEAVEANEGRSRMTETTISAPAIEGSNSLVDLAARINQDRRCGNRAQSKAGG